MEAGKVAYEAIGDYVAQNDTELTIEAGDIVYVIEKKDESGNKEWWRVEDEDGFVGIVPGNHLQLLDSAPPTEALPDLSERTVDGGRDAGDGAGPSQAPTVVEEEASENVPLTLKCTNCGSSIEFSMLESHSKMCFAQVDDSRIVEDTVGKLNVHVEAPLNVGMIKKQLSFLVVTDTSLTAAFGNEKFNVRRTAADFGWLHDALENSNPECVIPPLPRKKGVTQTANAYFISKRERGYNRFLKRVTGHQILRVHPYFRLFLTSTDKEMKRAKKEYRKKSHFELKYHKPQVKPAEDPKLFRAKAYLTNQEKLLYQLIKKVDQNIVEMTGVDPHSAQAVMTLIRESEVAKGHMEGVLKVHIGVLNSIDVETDKEIEQDYKQELKSMASYVSAALTHIKRIDDARDIETYWREQVQAIDGIAENAKKINEAKASQLRAQERVKLLSKGNIAELRMFDFQRERDFRDIMLEYTRRRIQRNDQISALWRTVQAQAELPVVATLRCIQ